jgi:HAMP domain-containing protein/cytochrome c551/c552
MGITRNLSIFHKILIVFIVVVVLSTISFIHLLNKTYQVNLVNQGRAIAQQVLIFRKWSASFGGVWTKNKYTTSIGFLMEIDTPEGTARAQSGEAIAMLGETHWYLHNPALATRELSGLTKTAYGWTFHVVSDRYMAPQDKPDAWETVAIKKIKQSKKRGGEYWGWDGSKFRFAKAIYVKKGCLKCHGPEEQIAPTIMKALKAKYGDNVRRAINYKEGDLRGIISVTIFPPSIIATAVTLIDIWNVGALVLAFLIFWYFARNEIVKPIERITKAAHDISLGKLDIDLGVRGLREEEVADEITKLAIAIDRLKASIQIAMERLKKK